MNDFTKDELRHLRLCANHYYQFQMKISQKNFSITKKELKLQKDFIIKLEKMIDNYCEHENDNRFNAIPEPQSIKWCKKCERFYL